MPNFSAAAVLSGLRTDTKFLKGEKLLTGIPLFDF